MNVSQPIGEAPEIDIVAEDYWAKKRDVDLYVHRKYAPGAGATPARPVLVLVHGSSQSARTTFDLEVPGQGEYSVMRVFARWGYDVWTLDHEGYGKSSRTAGWSYIADGAEDLEAAMPIIAEVTGRDAVFMFGQSSGALRAGLYCNRNPDRVAKLSLAAFPWTGKDAPSLIKRAQRLNEWTATNRREVSPDYYRQMVTRDVTGLTVPELPDAVAAAERQNGGDSVPNGTYVDMCTKLPLVDPSLITCPVQMIRAEHDGITTDEDTAAFFARLATRDKQLLVLSGQAHNSTFGINRHRFWHALRSFFDMPPRRDDLAG